MRSGIVLFFGIFLAITSLAGNLYSLKGKYIQLAPFSENDDYFEKVLGLTPIVYTPEVLTKGDFNKRWIHSNQHVFGVSLLIKDIVVFNEGKKNETIGIIATRDDEEIVIHVPLRYKDSEKPISSLWFTSEESESGFTCCYYKTNKRFIEIPYYDATLIDSLKSEYLGKIVYPIKLFGENGFEYIVKKKASNWYKKRFDVVLGEPYVFSGFSYSYPYGPIVYLTADFLDVDGNKFYLPINMNEIFENKAIRDLDTPSLENLSDYICTEDSLIQIVNTRYLTESDSLQELVGQELYLEQNQFYGYKIGNDYERSEHKFDKSGFYTLESVMIMPSVTRTFPFFEKYAILTQSSKKFAFPISTQSISNISSAAVKREEIKLAHEKSRMQQEQLERQAQAEEQAYRDSLIRKFGRSNAETIMNGYVKLGFTKAMCKEAWGEPFDITRATTSYGTTEAWLYSSGNILYFQGNKLIMIQD